MRSLYLLVLAIVLVGVIAPIVFLIQIPRKMYRKESISEYLHTCAVGIDQVGGSFLYGTEDWTVSSYTHILAVKGEKSAKLLEKVIDILFGDNHCKNSYINERKGGLK